jgi:hypothetical protein
MARSFIEALDMLMRPSTDARLTVERVRCFIKWHESRFDALDKPHEPISDPAGWTRRDEVWIKQAVWRDTIFELPPKRWTPLLSSFWSRKVFYGYGTSSICG